MNVTVYPGTLTGEVPAMPSKSHGHRLLLAAHLAGAPASVRVPAEAEDLLATEECLAALSDPVPALDCRESGSTLRFLLPVACVLKEQVVFLRRGRLSQRTLSPLREVMEAHGCLFEALQTEAAAWPREGDRSDLACNPSRDMPSLLQVRGKMSGGSFSFSGDVSSQFATGLLFALPLTEEGGTLTLIKPVVSRPYLDLTLQVLKDFHILVQTREDTGSLTFRIPGRQRFRAPRKPVSAEGDWSLAAFFICANVLGSHLHLNGLPRRTAQGDRIIETWAADIQLARPGETLTFSLKDHPDLLPPLLVMGWGKGIGLTLTDTGRLREKESDRILAMVSDLRCLGAEISADTNTLTLHPGPCRTPDRITFPVKAAADRKAPLAVEGYQDHRIVMAMAVAATVLDRPLTIRDAQAVRKSCPYFWDIFTSLGGSLAMGSRIAGKP